MMDPVLDATYVADAFIWLTVWAALGLAARAHIAKREAERHRDRSR